MNNIPDRTKKLEKHVDRLYAELDLLNTYIPKLMDTLIEYYKKTGEHRRVLDTIISVYRGELENMSNQTQEHFKYHSHTDKKSTTNKKRYSKYD